MDKMDVINIESDDDDCICTFWPPEKQIKRQKKCESFVKNEKMDDEIEQMAHQIAKKNESKMRSIDRENTRILKMMQIPPPTIVNTSVSKWKGKFGWETLPNLPNGYIPYIFRDDGKYCSIKMLQTKYMPDIRNPLYTDILKCPTITGYCMSADEVSLMNEINMFHSNGSFGKDFFTSKDMLISLHDTIEYYTFFKFASLKLTKPSPPLFQPRCGFILIDDTTLPYCVKNGQKFISLGFIDGDNTSIIKYDLDPWDMAYLKLCCIFLRFDIHIITNDPKAISIEDIKKLLPKNTSYVEKESLWRKCRRYMIQSFKKVPPNENTPRNLTPGTSKSSSTLLYAQKNATKPVPNSLPPLITNEKILEMSNTDEISGHKSINARNVLIQEQNVEHENKKYIQFPDAPLRKNRRVDTSELIAFSTQMVFVINKIIPCISYKANNCESLFLTIKDLVEYFMPNNTSLNKCEEMLRKNNINLYHPDEEMRKTLLEFKIIKSREERVTLVQVADVIQFIPKLRN